MAMRRHRAAFTLIEALVAITITALAGSTLLLGTSTSLKTTHDAQEQAIAQAMAQQLMDEIMGTGYLNDSGSAYAVTIQPDSSERSGSSRLSFDDIGDFNGYRCQPPKDAWGIELGKDDGAGGLRNAKFQVPAGMFDNWQQQVDVYYVSESAPMTQLSSGQTSDYRAVEVRIIYADPSGSTRELAKLRRVVAYVPPL